MGCLLNICRPDKDDDPRDEPNRPSGRRDSQIYKVAVEDRTTDTTATVEENPKQVEHKRKMNLQIQLKEKEKELEHLT